MDMKENLDINYMGDVEKKDVEELSANHHINDEDGLSLADEVHVIGGQALGDDAIDGMLPGDYVMDVDSDSTFDFYIAEESHDGIVDLDNAIDAYDDMDLNGEAIDAEPFVADVDIDEAFDFDIAGATPDGVVSSDEFYDMNDHYSLNDLPEDIKGNIIGYEPENEPENEPEYELEEPELYFDNEEPEILPDDIDFE